MSEAVNAPGPPDGYGYCLGGRVLLACEKCGALVCDTTLHTTFHDELSDEVGRAMAVRRQRKEMYAEALLREAERNSM